jgi:hypothetical protein
MDPAVIDRRYNSNSLNSRLMDVAAASANRTDSSHGELFRGVLFCGSTAIPQLRDRGYGSPVKTSLLS